MLTKHLVPKLRIGGANYLFRVGNLFCGGKEIVTSLYSSVQGQRELTL